MAPKGKSSRVSKKDRLKQRTAQSKGNASGSENPIPTTSTGTGLMVPTGLQENVAIRRSDLRNSTDVDEDLMSGNAAGRYDCGGRVQPNTEIPTSLLDAEVEKRETPEQIWNPPCRPMFKPLQQLKSWRDLRRCDEDESTQLITTLDTIRDSIEYLVSDYSGAVPLSHGTDAEQSQNSSTTMSQLLGTHFPEDTGLTSTFQSEFPSRVPEWRQRVQRLVPATGDEIVQNDFGASQFTAMARQPAGMPAGVSCDIRRTALQSGLKTTRSPVEPTFNRAVGSPLPMGSYTYISEQTYPLPRNFEPTTNNEYTRSRGPRTDSNSVITSTGYPAYGLNPAIPRSNQNVTQTVPATTIARPMELTPNQLFPLANYPEEDTTQAHTATASVPSALLVANDLSPLFTDQHSQTEYEITGYHRSDPTVLWADTIPSALAAPENRYPSSRLPGNGFVSTLSLDSPPNPSSSSFSSISFVEPNAPSTLAEKLLVHLNEKKERVRRNAEGDLWRRQHAAEVVRRHEEQVFAQRAQEGDWGLKGWHMSGEYHGQSACVKGRGAGFAGRGGRGGGRGGRGRGHSRVGEGSWGLKGER